MMLEVPSHIQLIELRNGKKVLTNSITDKVFELNDFSFDIITTIQINNCSSCEDLTIKLKKRFNYPLDSKVIANFVEMLIKRNVVNFNET